MPNNNIDPGESQDAETHNSPGDAETERRNTANVVLAMQVYGLASQLWAKNPSKINNRLRLVALEAMQEAKIERDR